MKDDKLNSRTAESETNNTVQPKEHQTETKEQNLLFSTEGQERRKLADATHTGLFQMVLTSNDACSSTLERESTPTKH